MLQAWLTRSASSSETLASREAQQSSPEGGAPPRRRADRSLAGRPPVVRRPCWLPRFLLTLCVGSRPLSAVPCPLRCCLPGLWLLLSRG